MSQDGRFREDLYYRLNVLSIEIPPLRERQNDIPILIDYFIKKHTKNSTTKIKGLSADAKKIFHDYSYPGNVRQLESAIERSVLLAEGDSVSLDDLPPEMLAKETSAATTTANGEPNFTLPPQGVNFEELERSLIMQAMERTDNNITKSAKLLGLTFRTLQYRLEKFGFKKDADASEEEET